MAYRRTFIHHRDHHRLSNYAASPRGATLILGFRAPRPRSYQAPSVPHLLLSSLSAAIFGSYSYSVLSLPRRIWRLEGDRLGHCQRSKRNRCSAFAANCRRWEIAMPSQTPLGRINLASSVESAEILEEAFPSRTCPLDPFTSGRPASNPTKRNETKRNEAS